MPGVGKAQHVREVLVGSGPRRHRGVPQDDAGAERCRQQRRRREQPAPAARSAAGHAGAAALRGDRSGPQRQRQQQQRGDDQRRLQAGHGQQRQRQQHARRGACHGGRVHRPRAFGRRGEGDRRDQAGKEERHRAGEVAGRHEQKLNRLVRDAEEVERQQAQHREHGDGADRHGGGAALQAPHHGGGRCQVRLPPAPSAGGQVEVGAAGREPEQGDADHHERQVMPLGEREVARQQCFQGQRRRRYREHQRQGHDAPAQRGRAWPVIGTNSTPRIRSTV